MAAVTGLLWIVLGFLHQAISWLVPFRQVDARPEPGWDTLGVVAGLAFSGLFLLFMEAPFQAWALGVHSLDALRGAVAGWPLGVVVLANVMLSDLCVYWAHRLLHSRGLWPTHAWHHSPRHVYWASGLRGSPLHFVFTLAPYSLVFVFLPLPQAGVVATGLGLFYIVNQHYLHSNIRFPFPRALEKVLVTPRFHFVHHSSTVVRTNSNYGFVFTWWDRLFGTYTDPETVPERDELGLDYEIGRLRLLVGLPGVRMRD